MPRDDAEDLNGRQLARRESLKALVDVVAPERPMRIADVGANPINVPDYTELQKIGGCEVWGFEPDPGAFAELKKNALPGSHFVQRAVGKPGPATFYPHPQSGLGSLFPIDHAAVSFFGKSRWRDQQKDGVELELVSLDALSEDELPSPDMLKIDIQGGELDVFKYGRKTLTRAICVLTEVRFGRIYENEPMWGDLDVELRAQGFVLHKLMFAQNVSVAHSLRSQTRGGKWRNQMLDGDAVYVRDPLTIADWDDAQVKNLALAAGSIFASHDLALHCLDELVARQALPENAPQVYFDNLPRWMKT